jgi:hypothetical protein
MQTKRAELQQLLPQSLNRLLLPIQQWTLHISNIINNSYHKDMTNKRQQPMHNNMLLLTYSNKDNISESANPADIACV